MASLRQQKLVRKLTTRKGRAEVNSFLMEGTKLCLEALATKQVKEMFVTEDWQLQHRDRLGDFKPTVVSPPVMKQLSQLDTSPDVIAIVDQLTPVPVSFTSGNTLVLDRINDPGNLGTIIRTADWFGIQQVVLTKGSVDPYNIKAVQATMGSILRVSVQLMENTQLITALKDTHLPVLAAEMEGLSLNELEVERNSVLIMGSESHGLDPSLSQIAQSITIPRLGTGESLNVAIAAGIILSRLSL